MGDPWQDEGYDGEDDWDEGKESLATDLEDAFDDAEQLDEEEEESSDDDDDEADEKRLTGQESPKLFGFLDLDHDTVYAGSPGAVAAEVDEPLDWRVVAFEDGLHRSVAVVAHPPGDAGGQCASPDRVAKEDTLDEALDDDAPPDHPAIIAAPLIAPCAR